MNLKTQLMHENDSHPLKHFQVVFRKLASTPKRRNSTNVFSIHAFWLPNNKFEHDRQRRGEMIWTWLVNADFKTKAECVHKAVLDAKIDGFFWIKNNDTFLNVPSLVWTKVHHLFVHPYAAWEISGHVWTKNNTLFACFPTDQPFKPPPTD